VAPSKFAAINMSVAFDALVLRSKVAPTTGTASPCDDSSSGRSCKDQNEFDERKLEERPTLLERTSGSCSCELGRETDILQKRVRLSFIEGLQFVTATETEPTAILSRSLVVLSFSVPK
jgi:hypothetical protein